MTRGARALRFFQSTLVGVSTLAAILAIAGHASPALAQSLRPNILIIFDTSGSMLENNTNDGSPLCSNNGQTSRIYSLKKALRDALVQVGTDEANFGLARFPELELPGQNPTCSKGHYNNNSTTAIGTSCGSSGQNCNDNCKCGCRLSTHANETTYGSWFDNGYRQSIVVDVTKRPTGVKPVASDFDPVDANLGAVFKWIDLSEDAGTGTTINDPELRTGNGWYTPLGRSLFYSRMYFENFVKPNDPKAGCRTNLVIVVTDGAETCDTTKGSALNLATCAQTGYGGFHPELQACLANVQTKTKVYVLTDSTTGAANDDIAKAGGTNAAIRVSLTDTSAVKAALIGIIAETVPPPETCNGKDDNCNGQIDEGVKNMCALDLSTLKHCAVEQCNCLDDNCNGQIDEGLPPNACGGGCGCSVPKESCNGLDDDCDGTPDNGFDVGAACDNGLKGVCKAPGIKVCKGDGTGTICDAPVITPGGEICNGLDDDCNGLVDDGVLPGIGEDCGPKLGACLGGKTICKNGQLTCQATGTMPGTEICNGIDDNCNGLIDEGTFPGVGDSCICAGLDPSQVGVGECRAGKKICAGAAGVVCDGCGLPQPEICDMKDNDCDGVVDTKAQCPTGFGCQSGKCVLLCTTGEFPCPAGYKCDAGICIPQRCAGVSCSLGMKCDEATGSCVDLCFGVNCASPAICKEGRCVDCRQLGCPSDQVCVAGSCQINKCATISCDLNSQYCDDGQCIDLCFGITCGAGQSCFGGTCRNDACAGVPCQDYQYCDKTTGTCKQDPCVAKSCPQGEVCVPMTGQCVASPCATIACPGPCFTCQVGSDGKGTCAFDNTQCSNRAVGLGAKGTGCGCDVPASGSGGGWTALLLGAVLAVARRPRRASRP